MLTRWYDTPMLFQSLFNDDFFNLDRRLFSLWDQAQSISAPRFSVFDDGHAVGLMEQVQTCRVAPLLACPLDQIVERRVGEPALVRPAVGVEQQPQEVLGIGVAG